MTWLLSLLKGTPILGTIADVVERWQDRKATITAHRAKWEIVQAKRASIGMRWLTFLIMWGPIGHAYYLAMKAASPLQKPEDVALVIESTFGTFPWWWTSAAVTILLAVWGIREKGDVDITRHIAKADENRAEAAKNLQERKTHAFKQGG